MQWDPEKCELVKDLWPTHSAGAICREIVRRYKGIRCTRNSIMGKAFRMKLLNQGGVGKGGGQLPTTNVRTARPSPPKLFKPKPKPAVFTPKPRRSTIGAALNAKPCLLVELDHTRCHWPLGPINDVASLFCGGDADEGVPYCPHHMRIAHTPGKWESNHYG